MSNAQEAFTMTVVLLAYRSPGSSYFGLPRNLGLSEGRLFGLNSRLAEVTSRQPTARACRLVVAGR